ncbi:hypothetical protein CWN76_04820 [Klebsiella quasipneumoniae]|nr:hypothetical protein CWN76_04820 [Klebsiella quasipneumoniae]
MPPGVGCAAARDKPAGDAVGRISVVVVGRIRRSRHPAQRRLRASAHRPAALRLPGLRGMSL